MFIFRTTEGEKIHNKVHAATLAIAAIHKNTTAVRILYLKKFNCYQKVMIQKEM